MVLSSKKEDEIFLTKGIRCKAKVLNKFEDKLYKTTNYKFILQIYTDSFANKKIVTADVGAAYLSTKIGDTVTVVFLKSKPEKIKLLSDIE